MYHFSLFLPIAVLGHCLTTGQIISLVSYILHTRDAALGRTCIYRFYSSISRTFLYLKISPKTGVRLILQASEMTCSNHGTNTYENMRLPYLFASASICTYLINVIEPQ